MARVKFNIADQPHEKVMAQKKFTHFVPRDKTT